MMNGSGGNPVKWRGFGDSEIGPLHRKLGLPNQDAWHLNLKSGATLIALADGLGSKPLSQLGAKAVCLAAERVKEHFAVEPKTKPEVLIKLFHDYWLDELQGQDIALCHCTALFAIALEEHTFIAQLGDGACCIITSGTKDSGQNIIFLANEDDGFFANQTHSLGKNFCAANWNIRLLPTAEIEGCFLVTDGIADDIATEHRESFFFHLLSQYQSLPDDEIALDVRQWISNWPVSGHSDDKTIVALFRQHLRIPRL